jgi:hypothetical protein
MDTHLATSGSTIPGHLANLGTWLYFTAPGASWWKLG